jgi:hypothetical protein
VAQFRYLGTIVTIKIWFTWKLSWDATIQSRSFYLLVCCLKTWQLEYTKL